VSGIRIMYSSAEVCTYLHTSVRMYEYIDAHISAGEISTAVEIPLEYVHMCTTSISLSLN
jgi:hypothetical protein